MPRPRTIIAVTASVLALAGLIVFIFALPQLVADRAAVPFVYMWMWAEDDEGGATIRCDAFRVGFEGQSFDSHRSGGNYIVDGRYPWRFFAGPEASTTTTAEGVAYGYSQRQRLLTISYQGHQLRYSHAQKQLTVDGQEFSTADGQVKLLVKQNGEIAVPGK